MYVFRHSVNIIINTPWT
jgi:hypothetical protein